VNSVPLLLKPKVSPRAAPGTAALTATAVGRLVASNTVEPRGEVPANPPINENERSALRTEARFE